jgi:hypothetical protein
MAKTKSIRAIAQILEDVANKDPAITGSDLNTIDLAIEDIYTGESLSLNEIHTLKEITNRNKDAARRSALSVYLKRRNANVYDSFCKTPTTEKTVDKIIENHLNSLPIVSLNELSMKDKFTQLGERRELIFFLDALYKRRTENEILKHIDRILYSADLILNSPGITWKKCQVNPAKEDEEPVISAPLDSKDYVVSFISKNKRCAYDALRIMRSKTKQDLTIPNDELVENFASFISANAIDYALCFLNPLQQTIESRYFRQNMERDYNKIISRIAAVEVGNCPNRTVITKKKDQNYMNPELTYLPADKIKVAPQGLKVLKELDHYYFFEDSIGTLLNVEEDLKND